MQEEGIWVAKYSGALEARGSLGVSEGHSKALTGHDASEANIFVSVYLYAIMIRFT